MRADGPSQGESRIDGGTSEMDILEQANLNGSQQVWGRQGERRLSLFIDENLVAMSDLIAADK